MLTKLVGQQESALHEDTEPAEASGRRIAELEAEVASLNNKSAADDENSRLLNESAAKQMAELEEALRKAKHSLSEEDRATHEWEAEVDKLKREVTDLTRRLESSQQQLKDAQECVAALESERGSLAEQHKAALAEQAKMHARVDEQLAEESEMVCVLKESLMVEQGKQQVVEERVQELGVQVRCMYGT